MAVSALFLLGSLGFAFLAQAQDCTKPKLGPNMSLSDEDILKDTFPDATQIQLKCVVGYTPAGGSRKITCTAGNWSPILMTCEKKTCGTIPEVSNGRIDYEGNEFGDKAKVTCNNGYKMIGNPELSCGDQGWIGRPPVCEVVKCLTPAEVANGHFSPTEESYNFGSVVTYRCDAGFTLNGTDQLTCSKDENFSPSPPKCVRVDCKDPDIPNGEFVEGSRPPHGHKATVTYKCKSGYDMEGSPSLTCNINSQWSPGVPKCIKSEVSPTPKATTTTTKATTTTSPGTKKPSGGSNSVGIGLGITAVVLVVGGIIAAVIFKKKKGSHGDNTDKATAKDGEDLALAQA